MQDDQPPQAIPAAAPETLLDQPLSSSTSDDPSGDPQKLAAPQEPAAELTGDGDTAAAAPDLEQPDDTLATDEVEAASETALAPAETAPPARPVIEVAPPPAPDLVLTPHLRGKVNFAAAQNGVSVLRGLTIANRGDTAVANVGLHLSATPTVLREKIWVIDRIAAGSEITIGDLATDFDMAILGGLDEAEIGQIRFAVTVNGVEVSHETHTVELLARDEWGGLAEMDNILAAFVSPNHPQVARLLKEAGRLLEAAGHSGAMEGYLSKDPQRVWMIAGAIWSAATGLGLTYAVPPASFEQNGQKIRDPERILAEGLATCLDSSLFLAAAFEAAGLNAAVLFSHDHAWLGVWLVPEDFGKLVEPDVVALRKAVAARDFLAIETTLLTRRPSIGFEQAVAAGRDHLSEAKEAEFEQAVDINRARAARIRPLASHRDSAAASGDVDQNAPAALPRPLDLGRLPGEISDESPTTALGRIERWQRKLLDLSLANRLLNFRETRLSLPLLCPDIAALEDRLADGDSLRLLALEDENAVAGRDLPADEARAIASGLAQDALLKGQIAVPLTQRDMANRLTELYRKARSDIAEGGTNTLFLAIGFLRWKRSEGDPKSYRAPLLLLPVKLERRSAQSEFRLSMFEDEIRINATLLELLKRDFELRIPGLEGELPRDANGVDIARILEMFRRGIRDVSGFEIVEETALSTFSFSKFLMWKDLVERTDQLRESALVRHLVDSPTESFAGALAPMPRPADLDRNHAPADLLTPLPADSSQLAAVLAAAEGRDFVLIGPPGTGKSQTITNIIADQLGRGRTVLFVAEKAAALDVVQRRLERQGLGAAVLELHSNKADRKKVLGQLGRSWDRASATDEQGWIRVTDDLRLGRDQLNAYVAALHRPSSQGFSVFEAIGQVAGEKAAEKGAEKAGGQGPAPLPFALTFARKDCHDATSWQALRDLAGEVGQRHAIVADLLADPAARTALALVGAGEWSFGWQDGILATAARLRLAHRALDEARAAVAAALGARPEGREALALIDALPDARLEQAAIPAAALADPAALRAALAPFKAALAEAKAARQALGGHYPDPVIATMPLDALDLQWREAQGRIWPLAGLAKNKLRKLLGTYAESGTADPATDLAALRRLAPQIAAIAASPLNILPHFAGEASDLAALEAAIAQAEGHAALLARLDALTAADGAGQVLAAQSRADLAEAGGGGFGPALSALRSAQESRLSAQAAFVAAGGAPFGDDDALDQALAGLEAQSGRFGDWLKWLATKARAEAGGLAPLVRALEEGAAIPDSAMMFERAYAAWWLRLAMDAEPVLRGFAHWEHEALVARFRALDQAMTERTAGEVMRRLGNDLPARDSVPRKSELGVLRHQLGLQRPTAAIRNLIAEMPASFPKLAPCVLMSPLSVAQYLPPGQALFDLVIFDEASQISTWDAIGAIARGRQAIIVGDPKQLPPTSFFARNDDSEGDLADLAEFEKDMPSILDEIGAAGVPTHRLNWHYRSRDEALIAFSNHNYYDGGLVTFPSPDASGQAVRLHRVAGTYLRGQGRTNPEEARAIAAMLRKRLTAALALPEDRRPTFGVITFNAQQQGLILDLLDAERKEDPALEWFFSDDREEPVIVKNLENIQGDERDIMLFSITFGPDQARKLTMNFGALNGDGGEKRLNVAVTRARAELHVFSSVTAEQIDLGRTAARGVRDLKAFLDFADRGAVALAAQDLGSLGGVESPFEEAVLAVLAGKGWEVHSQIGVSGFRIDLAVRHPDFAGVWLAGVECDGASYHGSATARDRDRIRQSVLEGLGWVILRIWSTDWFRAPQEAAGRIDAALRKLLEEDRARRLAEAEFRAAEALAEAEAEAEAEAQDQGADEYSASAPETGPDVDLGPEAALPQVPPADDSADESGEDAAATAAPLAAADAEGAAPEGRKFAALALSVGASAALSAPVAAAILPVSGDETAPAPAADPEQFFDESYTPRLAALIAAVVAAEAPLTEAALARRIAQEHGWQRTGARIQSRVAAFHDGLDRVVEGGTAFLWPLGGAADRAPYRGLAGRNPREISRAEIAALEDLHAARIASCDDPEQELARLMGIARFSGEAREHLRLCREWRAETAVQNPQ